MAEVYANKMAIACKAGSDKVLAAFPDVCLSPPSPPAGPIPVPYPDTSFSNAMKKGSKKVKIGKKPVMLKNKSYYKSSPLGNEPATRSFGASVITHQISGKTYFNAWSFDVKFEGKNVDRHLDLTTSNHGSFPGGPPQTALEKQTFGKIQEGKCPCCDGPLHSDGKPMSADQWYGSRVEREGEVDPVKFKKRAAKAAKKGKILTPPKTLKEKRAETRSILNQAKQREGCTCAGSDNKVMPEPPCNVFYGIPPAEPNLAAAQKKQSAMTAASRLKWYGASGDPESGYKHQYSKETGCSEVMHLVPLSAGGCPGAPGKNGNLQCKDSLCNVCKGIDDQFSAIQTVNINN